MSDQADPLKSAKREQRARVRHPYTQDTLCQPGEGRLDHAWWLSKVQDISASGIGLIMRHKFAQGTILTIELQSPADAEVTHTLQVRVMRVTPHQEGGWVLGCAFVNHLSEDELKAIL